MVFMDLEDEINQVIPKSSPGKLLKIMIFRL